MKDLPDLRELLVLQAHPALLDLLALSVTPARGALPVRLVWLDLTESLDLLEHLSCCLSVSVRVEELRVRPFLHRKPRQQPSCLKPGWL